MSTLLHKFRTFTSILRQGAPGQASFLACPERPPKEICSTDQLTGLPGLRAFESGLSQAGAAADLQNRHLALLVMNLDGFGAINQTLGHLCADQLLREVADRVRSVVDRHAVARLAGDEFVILMLDDPDPQDAAMLAARLIDEVGRPFDVNGRQASISCSLGIAMYPQHGAISSLTAHACAAMRAAKGKGGASYAFVDQRMLRDVNDEVALLRDLRLALTRQQFELHYQPKIHSPSGEITGVEALIRWNHPTRGVVSPAIFIPLAERCGLVNSIGRWVIGEACRQTRAWRDQRLRMRVAINLSAHQLRQADLAAQIADALRLHRISPDLLTCEVTESSAMDDVDATIAVLSDLARMGVRVSIDDFGTGHSSLSYLRKLPASELKIDRSFVLDLEASSDARKVALAVINLAKALDLKVVAEGVETQGQERLLREFGCDQLQGYLFAKPMTSRALYLWAAFDEGPRSMKFRDSLFKDSNDTAPLPLSL